MPLLAFAIAFGFQTWIKPVRPELSPAMQSLVSAEYSFADQAGRNGLKSAFLSNMADDATVFDPLPVNGREAWLRKPIGAPDAKLMWRPVFAEISSSGDLGYTTGPWTYMKAGKALAHGTYFTIWRREADGTWKFILDRGVAHSATYPADSAFRSLEKLRPGPARGTANPATLDPRLAGKMADLRKAYKELIDPDALVLRDSALPMSAKQAKLDATTELDRISQARAGFGMSEARDLAYTFGTVWSAVKGVDTQFAYVRVWRFDDGKWKLAVDLLSAI